MALKVFYDFSAYQTHWRAYEIELMSSWLCGRKEQIEEKQWSAPLEILYIEANSDMTECQIQCSLWYKHCLNSCEFIVLSSTKVMTQTQHQLTLIRSVSHHQISFKRAVFEVEEGQNLWTLEIFRFILGLLMMSTSHWKQNILLLGLNF